MIMSYEAVYNCVSLWVCLYVNVCVSGYVLECAMIENPIATFLSNLLR